MDQFVGNHLSQTNFPALLNAVVDQYPRVLHSMSAETGSFLCPVLISINRALALITFVNTLYH